MATVAEIQELYDKGKIQEAMNAVWAEVYEERPSNDPERGALMIIRAWCHWRRQEWSDALEWLEMAEKAGGAELKAKRLRAYFAAYRDKDDKVLLSIVAELPDDIDAQNALVIRARDGDSALTHAEIGRIVLSFSGDGVAAANLNHNGARFFLAKARGNADLFSAIGMLERAIQLYGTEGQWHHRAAAHHYKSQAHERLGEKAEALAMEQESARLWDKAIELDPQNKGFRDNRESAVKRIAELQG